MLEKLKELRSGKYPPFRKWKRLPETMNKKEKIALCALVFLFLFSAFSLVRGFYHSVTEEVPAAGGVYREGFIKSTHWLTINPVYSSQSDIERDIMEVAFDELMRFDKDGELVPHLAEGYQTNDHRVFDVKLRDDIYWSDGEPITADDVIFTVDVIQSRDYQSTLQQQWAGVQTEKLSENEVRFILNRSSSIFPENLTLKPIPEHIFKDMSPRDFRYSIYNVRTVGSGPYRFKEIEEGERIESITFERNPYYTFSEPYLNEVSFHFYASKEELLRAKQRGEINGIAPLSSAQEELRPEENGYRKYQYSLPRYFSLFFNLRDGIGEDHDIRTALSYATDREEILQEALQGEGVIMPSPLLADFYNFPLPQRRYEHHPEKAREILAQAGFENGKRVDEDPFRFTEDLREGSQGDEVRNLQRCLLHLDENLYPEGEVTGYFDEDLRDAVNRFQELHHEEILEPQGFTEGTGMVAGSTQEKLNELCADLFDESSSLEIVITTLEEPRLLRTAETIRDQWSRIGIEVRIEEKSLQELKEDVLQERDFEALLLGITLTGKPNPLPLWHSTKTEEPGINISGYSEESADQWAETVMSETGEEREEAFSKLQEKILEDAPAIFLYRPYFNYFVSEEVRGIEEGKLINASDRFQDIDKWHINIRRVFQ